MYRFVSLSKTIKNSIIFRISVFLCCFNNEVNTHKDINPLLRMEISTDLLLNLYFSDSSFACIVIIKNIWILKKDKKIILNIGRAKVFR